MPIRPEDIIPNSVKELPPAVINVFDMLIKREWNGNVAVVELNEAKEIISTHMNCTTQFLVDNHYLDVEPLYRQHGWKVVFEKKAYYETGSSKYYFSVA